MEVGRVTRMRKQGLSYADISRRLKELFPGSKGISERSVRRFCTSNGLTKMGEAEIDEVVGTTVAEVGETYGRKLMKGLLDSRGIYISETKVAESLKRVSPISYENRRHNMIDRTNPIPYSSSGFGHKLHLDQNEKLIMFGVTHVLAIDGYSGLIVAHTTIPIKNNRVIYERIYRKSVLLYGLWEQIRVDCGREFHLTLYVQEKLRQHYGSSTILPFVQTPSTQNLTVERIWPQVNMRVNYPLKRILYGMQERNLIDMHNPSTKFGVSFVVLNTASVGVQTFVSAWNSHFISGKGIPLQLSQIKYTTNIPLTCLPDTESAAQEFEEQLGGHLSHLSLYGNDLLRDRPDLIQIRDQVIISQVGSYEAIFSDAASNGGLLLERAIMLFISTTDRLTQLL